MTDAATAQGASPPEPLASQRLDMLGQLVVAQFDLEKALAELTRSGADTAPVQTQLQNLTQLQRQIGTATGATLALLRGEISAAIAQSQGAVQEARAAAGETVAMAAVSLASLARASRAQVTNLMRDLHQFDGELEFGSVAEQAAYRQREAERRALIEQEHAKHSPEGDLNAAGGAVGQMVDAHAHGANSPAFQQQWAALADSTQKLRDAIIRDGGDAAKFDQRLREDFRRILQSKGLSDAQIDARLAEHPDNPLEAVRAYMSEGDDVASLERSVTSASNAAVSGRPTSVAILTANEPTVKDDMAKFRAAGIVLADLAVDQPFAHGVSANEGAGPVSGRSAAT